LELFSLEKKAVQLPDGLYIPTALVRVDSLETTEEFCSNDEALRLLFHWAQCELAASANN
jgi:hypothetical protein